MKPLGPLHLQHRQKGVAHIIDQAGWEGTDQHEVSGMKTPEIKTGDLSMKDRPTDGRSERIRTSDPCLPKTVLYQAELRSVSGRRFSPSFGADQA